MNDENRRQGLRLLAHQGCLAGLDPDATGIDDFDAAFAGEVSDRSGSGCQIRVPTVMAPRSGDSLWVQIGTSAPRRVVVKWVAQENSRCSRIGVEFQDVGVTESTLQARAA